MTEPGAPCAMCGVRPDVGCRHRPAMTSTPVVVQEKVDKRHSKISGGGRFRIVTNADGNGRNFHHRKGDAK